VEAGIAEPVTMGERTMREWVSVQADKDSGETLALWLPLAKEALTYIQELSTKASAARQRRP
jgi:hypothetical protein